MIEEFFGQKYNEVIFFLQFIVILKSFSPVGRLRGHKRIVLFQNFIIA